MEEEAEKQQQKDVKPTLQSMGKILNCQAENTRIGNEFQSKT